MQEPEQPQQLPPTAAYPVYSQPTTPPTAMYPQVAQSPVTEPKKSKTLLWVLVAAGVGLFLLIGAGVGVGIFLASDKEKDPVAANTQTTSAAPQPSPSPSVVTTSAAPSASGIKLVTPESLGGRPLNQDPEISEQFEGMQGALLGGDNSVTAVYGSEADKNLTIVFASETDGSLNHQLSMGILAGAMKGMGVELKDPKDVEPGPLGGGAKCGSVKFEGVPTAMCLWADDHSIGVIWFIDKKPNDVKDEFAALRAQIEVTA